MKVFGCLCFVSTVKQGQSKFDTRADLAVFLGYPFGQKAYKTYNLNTNKIVASRDVVYYEQHFPFHLKSNFSSPISTFYLSMTTELVLFPTHITQHDLSPSCLNDTSMVPLNNNNVIDLSPHINNNLRRSSTSRKPPAYLQNYACNTSQDHWCNLVKTSSFSPTQQKHLSSPMTWVEPTTYKQASKGPLWIAVMHQELQALVSNNTWGMVLLPPGKKTIGCRWIYKINLKADGSLERYKVETFSLSFE